MSDILGSILTLYILFIFGFTMDDKPSPILPKTRRAALDRYKYRQ